VAAAPDVISLPTARRCSRSCASSRPRCQWCAGDRSARERLRAEPGATQRRPHRFSPASSLRSAANGCRRSKRARPPCRERRTDVLRRRGGRRVPPRGRLRRVILEREKPADLLVQAPNKYALVLNLKWGRRCLVQRYSAPRSTLGLDWPIAGRLCRSPDTR